MKGAVRRAKPAWDEMLWGGGWEVAGRWVGGGWEGLGGVRGIPYARKERAG